MIHLHDFPYFAYDTEGTGLRYPLDKAFGYSISTPDGNSMYVDIREQPEMVKWLNDSLRHYRGTVICHNASFDAKMSHAAGIKIPLHLLDDTVIRACLIDEHLNSYGLDFLLKKYLKMSKQGDDLYQVLADMFGGSPTRKAQIHRIQHAPSGVVGKYAIGDTDGTLKLWEWQEGEIKKQGIERICEFERSLIPTFIRAEMRGIRVDLNYAEEAADRLTPIIQEKLDRLHEHAGHEINTNSPKQIRELFEPKKTKSGWVAVDGTPLNQTDSGSPSFDSETLRKMKHPAAGLIVESRSLIKTRDTFMRGHVLNHAVDGRVYPNINQSKGEDGGTGTGRLSYQGPAMQQIPSRNKKVAAIVKPCFLPEEGHRWVEGDKASFEVRVFYHLINNRRIIEEYAKDPEKDGHQFVSDLTGMPRNAEYSGQANAKQLNLSMIFNSGNGAIADKMGMDWEWAEFTTRKGETIRYKKPGRKAMAVINEYHRKVPGVKELADGCKKTAERRGFIFTFSGRRLRFPRGYKSYKASGLLIQATAADINKENWKIIEDTLEEDEGHLLLNTHDSYSMSLPEDTWEEQYNAVKEAIERPILRVPMVLDFSGSGVNWWDAIKKDD